MKGIISNTIPDDIDINHCTVGNADYPTGGTWQYAFGDRHGDNDNFNVMNSVACNNSFLIGAHHLSSNSDYNNIYGNDDDNSHGSNDIHEDPLIDYILRVEPDSPNYGTASDGGHRGATILKR